MLHSAAKFVSIEEKSSENIYGEYNSLDSVNWNASEIFRDFNFFFFVHCGLL